jgi:hypothetical protein
METAQQLEFPARVLFLSTPPRANEISLLPYAEIDGRRTLSDAAILEIARESEKDGTFKRVFSSGHVKGPDDFLALVKAPDNVVTFVFRGSVPVGVAWLNSWSDNHATVHFYFRADCGADSLRAGAMLIAYWMAFRAQDGTALLDVLIGAVPADNVQAIEFGRALGFVAVGAIPKMLRNMYTGEKRPAMILYYVRR